ncbi:MAG TPA: DUF1843 domain-containing protein [Rhizomicrobium sp.]
MATTILYGVGIQQAIAGGDLKEMEAVARAAEQHIKEYGDVRTSLEVLKVEIAKHKGGRHPHVTA